MQHAKALLAFLTKYADSDAHGSLLSGHRCCSCSVIVLAVTLKGPDKSS